jgi:hypothetical protein
MSMNTTQRFTSPFYLKIYAFHVSKNMKEKHRITCTKHQPILETCITNGVTFYFKLNANVM